MTPAEQALIDVALAPCPFCGGDARLDHENDVAMAYVFCGHCGSISPACMSAQDAMAAWNRRALTPLEQAALAYVGRDTEPLSVASVERWGTLKAAARAVKEERDTP